MCLRDSTLFDAEKQFAVIVYCSVATLASIACFYAFGIRNALANYFSFGDALQVTKAAAASVLATTAITFALTRLETVPRSTPLVHALVLVAGLVAVRLAVRFASAASPHSAKWAGSAEEHVIVIGANRVAALFIDLLHRYSAGKSRVVAVLDEDGRVVGRAIARVRILGGPRDLESIIEEFKVHGIPVSRVVVTGSFEQVCPGSAEHVRSVCSAREIAVEALPLLAALSGPSPAVSSKEPGPLMGDLVSNRGYLIAKRAADIAISGAVLLAAMPLIAIVSIAVLIDIGAPVLFWQRRLGAKSGSFMIYKFRTLRAPFDSEGNPVPSEQRLSRVGRFLRTTHLDELPQLLNVAVGDMSLIGPRPLLPVDQPENPTIRLAVRPGITGWAQIHGGKNISIVDKNALDEWYVRNLSFRTDLKILVATALILFRGGSVEKWSGDAALAPVPVGSEASSSASAPA
jgi:lipopolysaccharide/colanic/teichoic acid biosynthesis glycosyltransferase